MTRRWFPETETCKCGHGRSEHGGDGRCALYAEAIEVRPAHDGYCAQVRQPEGTCYCQAFDGEPWPWSVWSSCKPVKLHDNDDGTATYTFGDAEHYTVQQQGNDKRYGPYKTEAAAERKANELNREMAQGPLDPEFKTRRDRLKRLDPGFGSYFYEGPPGARWPVRPDRYLAFGFQDGWHGEDYTTLYATLDAVREALEDEEGNEIYRVVDLDTGEDLKFERSVSVTLANGSEGQ